MPGRQRRDVGPSGADERDRSEYEGRLAELLANLKVEPGNPDLWMEAATIYVALGRRHRASKAYRASIEAVNERKTDEEAALARVHRLLHGDEVPPEDEGGGAETDFLVEQASVSGSVVQETQVQRLGPQVASATEHHPNLTSVLDDLDQLRRELTPRQTVTCSECNTLLEVGEPWCYGCGREVMESGMSLEERVVVARRRLKEHEDDPDALFTLAAHLAVTGHHDEALEYLIRLTALDPRYPGLWWVKARVFLDAGKADAAKASLKMARELMIEDA